MSEPRLAWDPEDEDYARHFFTAEFHFRIESPTDPDVQEIWLMYTRSGQGNFWDLVRAEKLHPTKVVGEAPNMLRKGEWVKTSPEWIRTLVDDFTDKLNAQVITGNTEIEL
jgi:hypothetical protein